MTKPLTRSTKSSLSNTRKDDDLILAAIEPVMDNFAEALDYRSDILRKGFLHFDEHVALNVVKFVKRL